jgi:cell shape-determining protein MreC
MVFLLVFLLIALAYIFSRNNTLEKSTQYIRDEISQLKEENIQLKTEIQNIKENKLSKAHLNSMSQAFENKAPLKEFEQMKRLIKEIELEVFKNSTADEFIERSKRVYGDEYPED